MQSPSISCVLELWCYLNFLFFPLKVITIYRSMYYGYYWYWDREITCTYIQFFHVKLLEFKSTVCVYDYIFSLFEKFPSETISFCVKSEQIQPIDIVFVCRHYNQKEDDFLDQFMRGRYKDLQSSKRFLVFFSSILYCFNLYFS